MEEQNPGRSCVLRKVEKTTWYVTPLPIDYDLTDQQEEAVQNTKTHSLFF